MRIGWVQCCECRAWTVVKDLFPGHWRQVVQWNWTGAMLRLPSMGDSRDNCQEEQACAPQVAGDDAVHLPGGVPGRPRPRARQPLGQLRARNVLLPLPRRRRHECASRLVHHQRPRCRPHARCLPANKGCRTGLGRGFLIHWWTMFNSLHTSDAKAGLVRPSIKIVHLGPPRNPTAQVPDACCWQTDPVAGTKAQMQMRV